MTRILHVVSPASAGDEAVMACAASIAATPDLSHRALVIGNDCDEQRAWTLGVSTTDRVHPQIGLARRAREWLAAAENAAGAFDLVQSWCGHSARLAMEIAGERAKCTAFVRVPACTLDITGLCSSPRSAVCTFSTDVRSALTRRSNQQDGGRSRALVRVLDHVAWNAGPPTTDRETIRSILGVAAQDRVLALMCHDPHSGDAMKFAFALGLLFVAGDAHVGLMPSGVRDERRAARFVRAHDRRWGLVRHELDLPSAVKAADALLWDDGGHGVLPGPWLRQLAREAGIRIIVPTDREAAHGIHSLTNELIFCDRPASRIVHAALTARAIVAPAALACPDKPQDQTLAHLWEELLNVAPDTIARGHAFSGVSA